MKKKYEKIEWYKKDTEMKKKKDKKKKCKHEDGVTGDYCNRCGFFEGTCDKCGAYLTGDENEGYEEQE